MNFSSNHYNFTSPIPVNDVKRRIFAATFIKPTFSYTATKKPFIGQVGNQGFKIVSTAYMWPICIFTGKYIVEKHKGTLITIETVMPKKLIILNIGWVVLIALLLIVPPVLRSTYTFSIIPFIFLTAGGIFFRIFLHGLYIIARKQTLSKLAEVLKA